MKINGEDVELVTSFGQLRTGLIVWVNPCAWCMRPTRGILIHLRLGTGQDVSGPPSAENLWSYLPVHTCLEDPRPGVIGRSTVNDKRVYAVAGQLPLAKRTTSRKLAKKANA